jgi:hypothetical protein
MLSPSDMGGPAGLRLFLPVRWELGLFRMMGPLPPLTSNIKLQTFTLLPSLTLDWRLFYARPPIYCRVA